MSRNKNLFTPFSLKNMALEAFDKIRQDEKPMKQKGL